MSLFVRALISVLGIALFAAGCFNPSVKSGGFKCDPSVSDACPSGFYCVNQLCVNHPGVSNGTGGGGGSVDMSMPAPGEDMTAPPTQSDDLSMTKAPDDLSQPPTPPDMTFVPPPTPPDMAQANTCAHDICTTGAKLKATCSACVAAVCAADSICCSSMWDDICVGETDDYCDAADQC